MREERKSDFYVWNGIYKRATYDWMVGIITDAGHMEYKKGEKYKAAHL